MGFADKIVCFSSLQNGERPSHRLRNIQRAGCDGWRTATIYEGLSDGIRRKGLIRKPENRAA